MKIIIVLLLSMAISTLIHATPIIESQVETKIAIVTEDTTEGNYLEFLDKTGGWFLESDPNYPNFEVSQVLRLSIDNNNTEDIEDDSICEIESLGFLTRGGKQL